MHITLKPRADTEKLYYQTGEVVGLFDNYIDVPNLSDLTFLTTVHFHDAAC